MHITTTAILALPALTSAYYLTPLEHGLYARGHLSDYDIDSIYLSRRGEFLDRVQASAAGGSQTMEMLTTTPAKNHLLPPSVAHVAGAVLGGAEAAIFSNSKSAPPKPMAPVATTGKDRPVTKQDYINKATQLAVETAKGPLGNAANPKSMKSAATIGAVQGKIGFAAGTALDKAVSAFKGAGAKAKAAASAIKKGKRDVSDWDAEDVWARDLFEDEEQVELWARGWDEEDVEEWY